MGRRGKVSAGELSVVSLEEYRNQFPPPPELTERQAEIWRRIVASEPADFLKGEARQQILMDLCRHREAADSISETINLFKPEWLKSDQGAKRYHSLLKMRELETRAAAEKATKLRLTNQSRYTPGAAATAGKHFEMDKPWED